MVWLGAEIMQVMLPIVHLIGPLVLIIVVGLVSGLSGLLSDAFRKSLSDFCYYFGMPALLIRTIASAPPSSTAPYLILGGYLVPIALVWIVATVYAEEDYKGPKKSGSSIAMASAYGNVIMLGIPLAFAQFGPASATTVALIVLVHSPVLFLAAALQAEFEEARSGSVAREAIVVPRHIAKVVHTGAMIATNLGRALRDVFVDLVTNPIIIGIGVGLLLRSSGAAVPLMADKALSLLGQATLPCVLLAIGFGLSTFRLKGEIGVIGVIGVLKLVAMPAAAWSITSRIFELPPLDVGVITLLTAMPTGANAYVFASRNGKAEASVSGAVAISTLASAVTVTIVLAIVGAIPG